MPKLTAVLRSMLLLAWAVAASSAVASASPRSWHPRKFARGDGGGFERERGPTPASRAPDRLVELTPSSEDTGLPSCGLHLFRHVSKTGGTTIRFVFDKNTAMGEWEYPLVYGFKREQWDDLVTKFRQAAGQRNEDGPRVLVEVRGNWPERWCAESFDEVLADVHKIKSDFPHCKVTTSILVRDPLKQYLSFYNYYIKREQQNRPREYGTTVADWARSVHDMQVRETLGSMCTPQMRDPTLDPATGERKPVQDECNVDEASLQRYLEILRSFDVVGTTDRFNSFILRLGHVAGLSNPRYRHHNAGSGSRERSSLSEDDSAALDEASRYDRRAYKEAVALASAQEAAWPDFEDKLLDFESRSTDDGYVGGKPPPSPFRFVHADEASASLGREGPREAPPWWLFEGGGRQAIAYINFKPVVLVERQDAERKGLRCVRACNLD